MFTATTFNSPSAYAVSPGKQDLSLRSARHFSPVVVETIVN